MIMTSESNPSRRDFLRRWLLGATSLALARVSASKAADTPLLSPDDPAAKKLKYTEDATQAKEAGGNNCSTCALYQGTYGSKQGPCEIFPLNQVKAAGWCSSWAPQI
jgi:High potential iron-sulfur protein